LHKTDAAFTGLSPETYDFFWDLAFHNYKSFFEENRTRYVTHVQKPLLALADALIPTALDIDPNFVTRPAAIVSRIRRDTRFSADKTPYRDHAWLGFKYPGASVSGSFCLYAEFERESYGYGMGMYCPNTEMMTQFRARMLARPQLFLSLVNDPALNERFSLHSESYKRPKFPDADAALQPYLNMKYFSWSFSSPDLTRTMHAGILNEVKEGFEILKPLYRFLMGMQD